MGLEDVKEWIHYCGRCNSCKYLYRNYNPSCPAFEKFQWECYTSSGKVWMARDIYEGKYPISESIRDKVFSCTLCGNCAEQCQQEVSNHALDIFEALREECVEHDLIKPEHKAFRENIAKFHNPYGQENSKKFDDIDPKYFKEHADVFLFVGCTTGLKNKQLLHDIIDVLDYFDVDFTLSRDEWCCGSPLFTTGQKKYAKELAQHNVDLFTKTGSSIILTACSGCYRSLKQQYGKKFGLLQGEFPKIMHLSEFLNKIIKSSAFNKPDHSIHVTYHDPCHLGRHIGVYEEPRNVIKKIPSVKLDEMPRNRQNAWCCGAGAGVKSGFKDWAVEIAEQRIQEASNLSIKGKQTVEYLITTCPFCERNLEDGLNSLNQKNLENPITFKVIDLIQFVKQFLKPKIAK
jgi:heterodisulfide reductase subunit D